MAGGHPWWTLSQLPDGKATELDLRPSPSARSQQSLEEIFAMLRAHVATGGYAAVVTRALVPRTAWWSNSVIPTRPQ